MISKRVGAQAWLSAALGTVCAGALGVSCTMDYGEFQFTGTGLAAGGGSPTTTTTTTTGTGATGGGPTGGSGGTGGSGLTGAGGQGGGCDFTVDNDCANAEEIQSVSGDTGTDSTQATGIGSHWLAVEVSENAGQSVPLSYTVELTSPAGAEYDLYVHESASDADAPDCSASAVQGSGTPEAVSSQWDETNGGGNNDQRWLAIEVRYVSGSGCQPGDEWTVTVNGHTQ